MADKPNARKPDPQTPGGQTADPQKPAPRDPEPPNDTRAAAPKTAPSRAPVGEGAFVALAAGQHGAPHDVLGPHPHDGGVTIRSLQPLARAVTLRIGDTEHALEHEHSGVWFVVIDQPDVPDYRVVATYEDGIPHERDDPYRFLPTLGDIDLHLIAEGRHEQIWTVLGAHVHSYEGFGTSITGTSFAVWAPNAKGVRVAGDFNAWNSGAHPMRLMGSTGVWELFVPNIGDGTMYHFDICGADGEWRRKADPLATHTEAPPARASVVFTSRYPWHDQGWMEQRTKSASSSAAMSVYEIHLGSWRLGRSYHDLAEELVDYVREMGFTHVEFMPVMEHPFGGSWGYQVTSYFAPTARLGSPDDLRFLVDRLHQAGIGVLMDWVPAHFPKDEWALARFDGTALYEHEDPKLGEHPEWGTYIFNFGRNEVRNFLVASALYWIEEFHIDGLRVDAVASMLYLDYSRPDGMWSPNKYGGRENLEAVSFIQEANATVYKRNPGVVMIAEESTDWPGVTRATHVGGLGFGFKWNMGWMHDSLGYMAREPVYRQYHHHQMTFSMMYAYAENYVLPLSHDEVVHGKGSLMRKMPGDRWQQLANLRAYLAFMWAHPGKQLIFMGMEIAQEAEWSEARELDWWLLDHVEHRGVRNLVSDLNRVYRETSALWSQDHKPAGFEWIDANDSGNNVFSFLRHGTDGSTVACVANFSAIPHHDYRIGLPRAGTWSEVLNTDSDTYVGSGVGNLGSVEATEPGHHGRPAAAKMQLPPLGTVWLRSP
jgi:1,4-alpha-glucan branching enzyme